MNANEARMSHQLVDAFSEQLNETDLTGGGVEFTDEDHRAIRAALRIAAMRLINIRRARIEAGGVSP